MKYPKLPFVLIVIGLAGCSVQLPEVRITGEKTALEREILGTYYLMREDTWILASTRGETILKPSYPMSPEKKRVLDALREQAFNRDDIQEFKREGWVAEKNDGTLIIRESAVKELPLDQQRLVEEIVQEENRDRQIIVERLIQLNDALKQVLPSEIARVLAKIYQEDSPPKTWIQTPEGKWVQK